MDCLQRIFVMQLKIRIFNYFCKDLEVIWSDFQRLSDDGCYVFQTYEWIEYWFYTVGKKNYSMLPLIITVFDDEDAIAIFPLGMYTKYSARIIEFIGGGQSDYNTPIVSSKVDLKNYNDIWNMVLNELPAYDILNLQRIPHKVVERDNLFLKVACVNKTGSTYSLKLPKSSDNLSSVVSKRLLKDNARMVRRLSELGQLKYSISSNRDEYNAIIEITLQQKTDRYLLTGVRNLLDNENIYSFYKGLYDGLSKSLNVHLSSLTLNGEVLATHLGIVYGKRFYYLMPTFSQGDYEKFSPGRLLLDFLVKNSIEEKLEVYDFTIGSELYKKKWCDNEMNIYSHQSYTSSKGFLFLFVLKIILFLKNNPTTRSLLMRIMRLRNIIPK